MVSLFNRRKFSVIFLFAAAHFAVGSSPISAKSLKEPKNIHHFAVLVENSVPVDSDFQTMLSSWRKLCRMQGCRISLHPLKGDLVSAIEGSLRELPVDVRKAILFTTASYPENSRSILKRDEYNKKLEFLPQIIRRFLNPKNLIVAKINVSSYHFIGNFDHIFRESPVIQPENPAHAADAMVPGILHAHRQLKFYDDGVTVKMADHAAADFQCLSRAGTGTDSDRVITMTTTSSGSSFRIATEKKGKLKIPVGLISCISRLRGPKYQYAYVSAFFPPPTLISSRTFFTLRYPRKRKVVERDFEVTSDEKISRVQLAVRIDDYKGSAPAFFSGPRKWHSSGDNLMFFPDTNGRPLAFQLKPEPSVFRFGFLGDPEWTMEGALILLRDGVKIHEIPLKIRSAIYLKDVAVFVRENALWLFPLVILLIFLPLLVRGISRRKSPEGAPLEHPFQLMLREGSGVALGPHAPENLRFSDISPLHLQYTGEIFEIIPEKGMPVQVHVRPGMTLEHGMPGVRIALEALELGTGEKVLRLKISPD